jgi:hypothetical protein
MPTINFKAEDEYFWKVAIKPFPASQAVPKWWKDMTPFVKTPENPEGKKFFINNYQANTTFKKCIPMLDSLTSGYIVPLWADVFVEQTIQGPMINWRVRGRDVFAPHGPTSGKVETPPGYNGGVFKYINGWIPQLPRGYSLMITAPTGYRNLPFQAIPAIIDSDKSTQSLFTPMWLKENFEGIVEKGTPMFQVTPFKRESWKSKFSFYENGEYRIVEDKTFGTTIINHYIKNHWTKKEYR